MQRWSASLGRRFFSSSRLALDASPVRHVYTGAFPVISPKTLPGWTDCFMSNRQLPRAGFSRPSPVINWMQVRDYAGKSKDRSRAPLTPTTSKVKKYKLKAPSSFKFRFRTMKDGQIRRWRAGKRHNAHLKSKAAKRRLRKPAIVHAAYAKVIKKLNFCS
ncbi:Ribosomal protein L35 [Carex littledalei]|uniref:Ribosomal protein L35 n=1 Tax=Carex littledalei TaxID=544730 RepID=A0A833VEK3_9POAL|nr:Ribosomal protein L35 [Carex littledalei]